MASSKQAVSEARTLITAQLASLGFRKHKELIFTCGLNEETKGWIGLNDVAEKGKYWVNPVIGVRNQVIAELQATLVGEELHPYAGPTLTRTLVDLIPGRGFDLWLFEEGTDSERTAGELGRFVTSHGLPFMRHFLRRHDMLSVLRKPYQEHSIATGVYTVPLLMYSLGDYAGAKKAMEEFIVQYEHDPMNTGLLKQYRAFAAKLLPLLAPKH
jgi:hypothetical protein